MIDVNVDKNATVSNQYTFARFTVLVSVAARTMTANHPKTTSQALHTKITHNIAQVAAQIALVEWIVFSKVFALNAGAAPVNKIPPAVKKAKNWRSLPVEISNQAGISKTTRSVIIIGKEILIQFFLFIYR